MRKPARQVDLEDIISTQILREDPEVLALTIKIHLALEALLIELIRTRRTDEKVDKLPFPQKARLLVDEGLITVSDEQAFNLFNEFRNDFAHIFGHRVELTEVLRLARDLERHGVDFSDSVGHYPEAQAAEYYNGLFGLLSEVGWCILFHAGHALVENGGRDIFGSIE